MTSHLGLGARKGPGDRQLASLSAARPGAGVAPARRRRGWESGYLAATVVCDTIAVVISVVVGDELGLGSHVPGFGDVSPGVGAVAGILILFSLLAGRAWDPVVLGQGSEELGRLIRAVVTAAVVLGLTGLAFRATAVRPWVFGLMPVAGLLATLFRLALRSRLHGLRADGRCVLPVLAVGTVESVEDLIDQTRRDTRRGWVVTAVCTPSGVPAAGRSDVLGVPVLGDLDAVAGVARDGGHRVVAVCPTPGMTSRRLHGLAWTLEDVDAELVVDPGLMEVAGPRLHIDPVDGLPLLRLSRPTFTGPPRVVKHGVDKVGSALLLLLLAPLLLVLAVGVRLDGGPAFFRQTRIGRHGREFTMIRFRSVRVDAERLRGELIAADEGAGPLLEMRRDPRVTRFGAVLRRYSLDELPQLLNVLSGSMSLVGPRPPLPVEVATYGRDAERRLVVRPGLTGLWQIDGRSDLSWEQSVRLDLRYVENWNLALDAQILCRTVGSVATSRGTY